MHRAAPRQLCKPTMMAPDDSSSFELAAPIVLGDMPVLQVRPPPGPLAVSISLSPSAVCRCKNQGRDPTATILNDSGHRTHCHTHRLQLEPLARRLERVASGSFCHGFCHRELRPERPGFLRRSTEKSPSASIALSRRKIVAESATCPR